MSTATTQTTTLTGHGWPHTDLFPQYRSKCLVCFRFGLLVSIEVLCIGSSRSSNEKWSPITRIWIEDKTREWISEEEQAVAEQTFQLDCSDSKSWKCAWIVHSKHYSRILIEASARSSSSASIDFLLYNNSASFDCNFVLCLCFFSPHTRRRTNSNRCISPALIMASSRLIETRRRRRR